MEYLSLLELNEQIGSVLKKGLEPSYWIIAEIGEMRVTQKGHCYLEMVEKEDDRILAKMRATIWSFTYRNLSAWFQRFTGEGLRQGLKILFNATVEFHEVYGLSLNIKDIDARYTLGERAKKRNETVARLKEDGVYDMNKELPLPLAPQHIAVISSPTAAGYGDFMNQLENNIYGYSFHIRLFDALMQGDQAEKSIIDAMHRVFDRIGEFDLLVIIRGGGASLDLDCYDSYELSSHIAQFPIPVITGIGHERDETVADEVAHTRLKTPTAVAEFLISGLRAFEDRLDLQMENISQYVGAFLQETSYTLEHYSRELYRNADNLLHANEKNLVHWQHLLTLRSTQCMERKKTEIDKLEELIKSLPGKILNMETERLLQKERTLKILDPEQVLKRGYTITTVNGTLLKNIPAPEKGSELVTVSTGRTVVSEIKNVKPKKS